MISLNRLKCIPVLAGILVTLHCAAFPGKHTDQQVKSAFAKQLSSQFSFTENKGQVADHAGHLRPDVLFMAHTGNTRVYLTATSIQYQFTKVKYPQGYDMMNGNGANMAEMQKLEQKIETQDYRFSLNLAGANPHPAVRKENKTGHTEHFYLAQCADGITDVASFDKVVYENVYPNIDWVIYSLNGSLKYDFIVRPGGDAGQIKLVVKDATHTAITRAGELLMQTTLGEVLEKAPSSTVNGQSVPTSFKRNGDGSIGFSVKPAPAGATLIIDPTVTWSTYFGGSGTDQSLSCSVDPSGNVFLSGISSSTAGIATSGGFQTTLGGASDAFLAKFSPSGALLWATYYGGSGSEFQTNCVADNSGNVYISGNTSTTTGMTTPGVYQPVFGGGGGDDYLAKFSASGTRLWCTYFGGPLGESTVTACAADASGNVYLTGVTPSTTGIASPGAYQTTYGGGASDQFLAKFNGAGGLLWSTYYGGAGNEGSGGYHSVAVDNSGNVYTSGITTSTAGIATTGSYQAAFGGGTGDAYLVKFDGSGARIWATYYGGPGNELTSNTCTTDAFGNVFLATNTTSTTGISTPGSYQPALSAGTDACMAKFTSAGTLRWSTYVGGNGTDICSVLATNSLGHVFIAGYTGSTTGIASVGAFQSVYGGANDGMVMKFDSTGARQWGSYFGGPTLDEGFGCAPDAAGNIYLCGLTSSPSGISGAGAFQPAIGGGQDAFLYKVADVVLVSITTGTVTGSPFCAGATVSVPFTITSTFTSGNVFTAQLSDASGSFTSGTSIGTLTGTAAGTITATIPATTAGGTGYRIRVIGSAPVDTGTINLTDLVITALPAPGAITGATTVCPLATTTLTDAPAGGVWSSVSPAIATISATGVVTGVSAGTATISYTVTNSCGATSVTTIVTVNPLPDPGTITGTATVCPLATTLLTDGSAGGSWSSGTPGIATVSASGVVTGAAAGTATISYSVTNGCGTATATTTVTVNPLPPPPAAIGGIASVCPGNTTTLSELTTGGVWSSASAGIAIIGTGGVVTGVSAGTAVISYAVTNGCGTTAATIIVTVNAMPAAGSITGMAPVCVLAATPLSDLATGGVWSSSAPAIATVNSTGLLRGVSAGSATISYTVTNSCGTAAATAIATVNPLPDTGTITGSPLMCPLTTMLLTDAATGGSWSSTVPAVATVSASGLVTSVSLGTTTISYTVMNGCGTAAAIFPLTVNALPSAGTITGTAALCALATTTLSDGLTGGTWSSANPAIAVVSASGVVTGVSAGTAVISYSVTNSCGTAAATRTVTVNLLPDAGTITGATTVCELAATMLSDAAGSGTWTSANISVAAVDAGGTLTGISPGTTTISYTVVNGCGTAVATRPVSVNPLPAAGIITGTMAVCPLSSTLLADAAPGGVWSSADATIATVSPAGLVSGVASGMVSISYTVTNACGTGVATALVSVNNLPTAGTVTGPGTVCELSVITLTDPYAGGSWSSSAPAIASVSASGVVSGRLPGVATISYTVANACGTAVASSTVTVDPLPSAGTITGTSVLCRGTSAPYTSSATGGLWSSSATWIATAGTTGIITGTGAGVATISYTFTNRCGSASATRPLTVYGLPVIRPISGPSSLCELTTITLTDAAFSGVWSSTVPSVASVGSGSGIVTGVSGGIATISYTVSNGCGSAVATANVTVNPIPVVADIDGDSLICGTGSVTLADTTSGGVWSSGNVAVATISTAGVVTSTGTGTTTISYSVTNSCATISALKYVTVNAIPTPAIVVAGFTLTTTVPYASYQWSLSGLPIAGATASAYTATVNGLYSVAVTDSVGCPGASASVPVTLASLAVKGPGVSDDLSIYPNPATESLNIRASAVVNAEISGMDGKILMVIQDARNIDISTLMPGLYVIRMSSPSGIILKTARFTKN